MLCTIAYRSACFSNLPLFLNFLRCLAFHTDTRAVAARPPQAGLWWDKLRNYTDQCPQEGSSPSLSSHPLGTLVLKLWGLNCVNYTIFSCFFCEIGTYSKYRYDSFELSSDFTFNFFATMFRSALKSAFYVNLMCCSVAQTLSRCRSCALPAAFRQV